jgi:four helix bundle protein
LRIADCGLRIEIRLAILVAGNVITTSRRAAMAKSADEFKKRTKQFGLRVIHLVDSLPNKRSARVIGDQLLRSGTSVGANYRAACRARSSAEFCAKMGIVEEEADESGYWMELLIDGGLVKANLLKSLLQEANEIVAMVVASIRTSRATKDRRR